MNKIIEEIQKNIINDFNDYMSEQEKEISKHYEVNECYINNYITSMHYLIVENTENFEQAKEAEEEIYTMLDNYCNNNITTTQEIMQKINHFEDVAMTNPCYNSKYYFEDRKKLIKELEQKYNCKIDDFCEIKISFNN